MTTKFICQAADADTLMPPNEARKSSFESILLFVIIIISMPLSVSKKVKPLSSGGGCYARRLPQPPPWSMESGRIPTGNNISIRNPDGFRPETTFLFAIRTDSVRKQHFYPQSGRIPTGNNISVRNPDGFRPETTFLFAIRTDSVRRYGEKVSPSWGSGRDSG